MLVGKIFDAADMIIAVNGTYQSTGEYIPVKPYISYLVDELQNKISLEKMVLPVERMQLNPCIIKDEIIDNGKMVKEKIL